MNNDSIFCNNFWRMINGTIYSIQKTEKDRMTSRLTNASYQTTESRTINKYQSAYRWISRTKHSAFYDQLYLNEHSMSTLFYKVMVFYCARQWTSESEMSMAFVFISPHTCRVITWIGEQVKIKHYFYAC